MNGHEGLTRIARVIGAIGWIWMAVAIFAAASDYDTPRQQSAMLFAILGIVGFVIAQAIAWIIKGFAAPRG